MVWNCWWVAGIYGWRRSPSGRDYSCCCYWTHHLSGLENIYSVKEAHIGTQVLIRYLRSFSFCQKWLTTWFFGTFVSEKNFIVSKLITPKSKLRDFNLPFFTAAKSQWNFSQKNNFIVTEISFIVVEKFHCDQRIVSAWFIVIFLQLWYNNKKDRK